MRAEIFVTRRLLGYSQESLAAALGVTRQTLNAIETGRRLPSFALALRIAHTLHSSVHEFWTPDAALVEWNGRAAWEKLEKVDSAT